MSVISVVGGDALAGKLAEAVSGYLCLKGKAEVEFISCTPEEIRELNFRTRGVDKATDVLSFPALACSYGSYRPFTAENYPLDIDPQSGNVVLGSVAVCDLIARGQAEEYGHSEERERGYLFLHGLLHLLGYDHMEENDKAAMREVEEAVLSRAGLVRGE